MLPIPKRMPKKVRFSNPKASDTAPASGSEPTSEEQPGPSCRSPRTEGGATGSGAATGNTWCPYGSEPTAEEPERGSGAATGEPTAEEPGRSSASGAGSLAAMEQQEASRAAGTDGGGSGGGSGTGQWTWNSNQGHQQFQAYVVWPAGWQPDAGWDNGGGLSDGTNNWYATPFPSWSGHQ